MKMTTAKDFSCVGGLDKHIKIVKEMVLFPLMYGEIYAKFNLKPPRGLLFYGPPGTGKTLVASTLAVECSNSDRKVSFISRKGADCLSKWVGESEKKLQKIFTMAQQSRPCIIFFDEIDGLAPVRSSKQDFVHASMVSTLLALMDGLENNSEIVVIGATNRIDAIDPALRRPGRFDRELYFPVPCYIARKDILSVHMKSWKQKPTQKFLAYLASETIGFSGSDLQALCTEAVMCCVRRNYPQIYTSKSKYHINERYIRIEKQDFLKAQQHIVPASHRVTPVPVKRLSIKMQPLLQDSLCNITTRLQTLCPIGFLTSDCIVGKAAGRSTNCPRILLCGDDDCHTRHLGPAILHTLEHLPCHVLNVTSLFEETGRAVEESIIQTMKNARRNLPSLLYVPDILTWWHLVGDSARMIFTSLIRSLDHSVHILIVTTAHSRLADLPAEITDMFDEHQGEVFEIKPPSIQERQAFFRQLFLNSASDTDSNESQDFVQATGFKRGKEVCRRQKSVNAVDSRELISPQIIELPSGRRGKDGMKSGSKLNAVQSCNSNINVRTRLNSKREVNTFTEGPVPKRQKLTTAIAKLPDVKAQNLLQKIVKLTDKWVHSQLESLFTYIEFAIEKTEDDTRNVIETCLKQYIDMKKHRVKRDDYY